MKITDATVLITGAAKRVGAEIARTFAAAGAKVIVHCNTSRTEAEQLTEELGGEAAGHSVVCCDLSNPENIPALFRAISQSLSTTPRFSTVRIWNTKRSPAPKNSSI